MEVEQSYDGRRPAAKATSLSGADSSTEGSQHDDDAGPVSPGRANMNEEDALISALGLTMIAPDSPGLGGVQPEEALEMDEDAHVKTLADDEYYVIPNPEADELDLSVLRGTRAPQSENETPRMAHKDETAEEDLQALAELVPELKSRVEDNSESAIETPVEKHGNIADENNIEDEDEDEVDPANQRWSENTHRSASGIGAFGVAAAGIENQDSMQVQESTDDDEVAAAQKVEKENGVSESSVEVNELGERFEDEEQNLGGFDASADHDSDDALEPSVASDDAGHRSAAVRKGLPDSHIAPSSASLSTATQTHEVRMPMYLPTFKPATGCTNASDFIVRCFVARLRSGITVVKHGRSRWSKSRLRILHVHSDGRSLSWKPALGEPTSSKRPPKLDLSTCTEVRHAWSPDPLNPMFTGTPILRQKCEAANAHKSFALIFPKRTVDITAVTADQCKVLMEGFSALCFRLQVANLAGRGSKKKEDEPRAGEEEDGTTASVTITDNSNNLSPNGTKKVEPKRSNYW